MGIDVSGLFQAMGRNGWVPVKTHHDGQRGLLRYWLGWAGGGWYEADFGVKSLVECPRGLPHDFAQSSDTYVVQNLRSIEAIGTQNQSWLDVDEILRALPILGHRKVSVPLARARGLADRKAKPIQWAMCAGGEAIGWSEEELPRLIDVIPNWAECSSDDVHVDFVFDFEHEIQDFITEIGTLRQSYEQVRFEYGFE